MVNKQKKKEAVKPIVASKVSVPVSSSTFTLHGTMWKIIPSILAGLAALLVAYYQGSLNIVNIAKDAESISSTSFSSNILDKEAVIPKVARPDGKAPEVVKDCIDRYPKDCATYATNGDCLKFPGWLTINCPKACDFCHLRDPKARCTHSAINTSSEAIYKPYEMTQMFENLIERFHGKYKINVHSTAPWIVTFEDFLSNDEMNAMISTVSKWERSTDSGEFNEYGEQGRILSNGRTSSNAWCTGDCENNPSVQNVYRKINEVTGIPKSHYESFQILRYEIGQKYDVHHDMSVDDVKLVCGPRILTFFLYLSDVEEGGETAFPLLNIDIKPKRGMGLLWPSVLDDEMHLVNRDDRTHHQAKPVIKGRKYAANAWIHSHDFMTANTWGCTGSFDDL